MESDGLAAVGVEEARVVLGRLVDEVGEGRPVVLTKRGRPAAVLLSVEDYDHLLNHYRERHQEHVRDALAEARKLMAHSPESSSLIAEAIAALDAVEGTGSH